MTLQELRAKLSWLRENGDNVTKSLCVAVVYEYLSDKEEISRAVFSEIRKYINMVYCNPFCDNYVGCEQKCDVNNNRFKFLSEEAKNKIAYFDYSDGKQEVRRIRIVD